MGRFIIRPQGGSVLCVCTKFQADSSFRSKVIRGSKNFETGLRDPSHDHLGVVLYSVRRKGPSSISVLNLKRIAQFVQRGSQNLEIRSRDPSHAHLGVVLWSIRREAPSCMYAQISSGSLFSFKSY